MEMLEEIIAAPIFIQISTFAVKLAINLYYIETVSCDYHEWNLLCQRYARFMLTARTGDT